MVGACLHERFIRSSRPFFPKEDIDLICRDIAKALDEGRLRNGRNLADFERMFAEYIGVGEAVAFDSDGNALETALQHFGVKGREVVVCTNSFVSIPNSVVYAGGKVVFADIREETLSMDPASLVKCVSEDTCGVVVTHIAGFPNPDLMEIVEVCRDRGLFLVEDATHAAGATFDSRKIGSFGDAAVFAFTPTKVLTTGEGGMLVSNDSGLCEEARRFRYYGSGQGKTSFVNLGRHMMLPEVSAILGIYQLRRVEEFVARRNEIARVYDVELGGSGSFRVVKCAPHGRSSYYKYPLILADHVERVRFTGLLEEEFGVETGNVFYPPCHMQPIYQKQENSVSGKLPVSERVLAQTITLPMHVTMTDQNVNHVIESCKLALSRLS